MKFVLWMGPQDRCVWSCPGSQQHLQCDVWGRECVGTQERGRGGAWKHRTQALGCAGFILTPFKLNMNCGPWKLYVVIFQAADVLGGTHGVLLSSLAHSCLLRPAQDTCGHTSVWCPASSGLLQDYPF